MSPKGMTLRAFQSMLSKTISFATCRCLFCFHMFFLEFIVFEFHGPYLIQADNISTTPRGGTQCSATSTFSPYLECRSVFTIFSLGKKLKGNLRFCWGNDMQLVDLKMHYLRIAVSYEGQTCFATHYGPFRPFWTRFGVFLR